MVLTDVLTYHNDNARTGQNLTEQTLTPANVTSSFGKLYEDVVDGKVDAQPLVKTQVPIPTLGTHNVLYVVTEHDSVYAFDADSSGAALWHVSVLGAGESSSDDRGCSQVSPEIGITSTPVIDPAAGPHGTIYLVAMSKNTTSGAYIQRVHALDMTTGAEEFGGPVTVTATFSPGPAFVAKQYKERAGLLLLNGQLITGWASHCDAGAYNGWIMAYDQNTLAQTSVLDVTPNGSEGAIWQAGGGLAADNSTGNIFLLDANGTFDTSLTMQGFPTKGDFGNGFLKLSNSSGLQVTDYFEPFNTVSESNGDTDLGSGGAMVLPDMIDQNGLTRHLAVGAGKDGNIYLVDRDNMGKWISANNNNAYQPLSGALSNGEWANPAYFNGTLYYGGVSDPLQAFAFSQARLVAMPSSKTSAIFGYPGTTPSISANGTSNAIVWAMENGASGGVLHAYDATNLATELYNSGPSSFAANKFMTPTIANGKVYVGTPDSVAVFGLMPRNGVRLGLRIVRGDKSKHQRLQLAAMRPEQDRGAVRAAGVNLDRLRRHRQAVQDFRLPSDQRVVGRRDKQDWRTDVADRFGYDQSAEAGRRRDANDSRDLLARGNDDCGLGAETRARDEDPRNAGAHVPVGSQQIGAGELGAGLSLRFRESAEIKSQGLEAVRRKHLREVGPIRLIGGIHVREDYAGRAGPVKMPAQQHSIGCGERDVFATEILRFARRSRCEASCDKHENHSNRNCATSMIHYRL